MRIAVPLSEPGFDAEIPEHFGRAGYFAFVDVDGDSIVNVEIVQAPFEEHGPGDIPNFVKEHGWEVVLAYGMGGKAMAYFEGLGITVVTGAYGRVKDVVEAFIHQVLEIDPHWKGRIKGDEAQMTKFLNEFSFIPLVVGWESKTSHRAGSRALWEPVL